MKIENFQSFFYETINISPNLTLVTRPSNTAYSEAYRPLDLLDFGGKNETLPEKI